MGARCAGCRSAPPTRCSTGSPTSPSPAAARRGCGPTTPRCAPTSTRPALDALVRDGHAALPALLLRGVPAAGPHRPTTSPSGCGSRATARCARSSTAAARSSPSSATSATGTSPAPGAPPTSGPVTTVAERLEARGGLRGVPRLPRVARHDDHPAHRWGQPLPARCARRPGGRASSRCSPTATSPPDGVEVELLRPRRPDGARPGRAGPGRAAPAAPGLHPARAARAGLGHRHHLPPGRSTCPRPGTTRERATAMTQACADVLGAAIARAHQPTGTCCSGSSSTTSTTTASPAATARGRDEDRPGLPLLVGRARRGAVPRARPRRALHPRGPRRLGARPGRRRHRAARLPHLVRPPGPGALQRLGRPGDLRAGHLRPGQPLARGRATSTCCTSTSRSTPRRR